MESKDGIREFLVSRRARVSPEQVGLPSGMSGRRVAGLRRTEVATLAGISVEYYTRVERGNTGGVSDDVLDAIARTLLLDDAERTHLFNLARARNTTSPARRPTPERVRPGVQAVLDSMTETPAWVRNGRLDVLAANPLARAVYAQMLESSGNPPNSARYMFLDPGAVEFYTDWDNVTRSAVAILRAEAGRDPYDKRLTDLIGELSTRSKEFRTRWAAQDVLRQRDGIKRYHHPIVGDIEFRFEAFDLPDDPGQTMLVYTTETGSPSRHALNLLASWVATDEMPAATSDMTKAAE